MNTEEQIEQQFTAAVADYLRCFNRLERNIGYSVRYMKRSVGESEAVIDSTFHGKICQFKTLVTQRSLIASFEDWFVAVDGCRTMRNNIVHGDWEVVPHLDKPIRFDTQQPGQQEDQVMQGCFTLQEFLSQLTKLMEVSDTFSKLRQTHGI